MFKEDVHSAVQALHVEFTVDVYAFGPKSGPQVIIDVARPDVFAEEVVARARLDFQEYLFAFYPREERCIVHNHSFRKIFHFSNCQTPFTLECSELM